MELMAGEERIRNASRGECFVPGEKLPAVGLSRRDGLPHRSSPHWYGWFSAEVNKCPLLPALRMYTCHLGAYRRYLPTKRCPPCRVNPGTPSLLHQNPAAALPRQPANPTTYLPTTLPPTITHPPSFHPPASLCRALLSSPAIMMRMMMLIMVLTTLCSGNRLVFILLKATT